MTGEDKPPKMILRIYAGGHIYAPTGMSLVRKPSKDSICRFKKPNSNIEVMGSLRVVMYCLLYCSLATSTFKFHENLNWGRHDTHISSLLPTIKTMFS